MGKKNAMDFVDGVLSFVSFFYTKMKEGAFN
jgi:hypothetical protein